MTIFEKNQKWSFYKGGNNLRTPSDIITDKIFEIANLVLTRIIKPDIELKNVRELDIETIERLKKEYGIEAIILDVDETLRKNLNEIPKCNQEWIEEVKKHIKVIVVTNGLEAKAEQYFKEQDIEYIGLAFKPLKRGFIKACKSLNVKPENVLVVGDDLWDDIHGGQKNKMKTALVKDVEEER